MRDLFRRSLTREIPSNPDSPRLLKKAQMQGDTPQVE
jgi:hypothetical protein